MFKAKSHFLFLFLFLSILPGINAQSSLTKITIASEPDYPPYCLVDKNGKADGFSVDLFLAAAKEMRLPVDIKIGVWNLIKEDLAEGKIDALPLVGKTPEREIIFDFTIPYITLHGAVFVRKGTTDIKTLEDLKNRSVVVMKGDNSEEFVRRANISNKIITVNTFKEAFQLLANGNYSAVICQRVMGLELLKKLEIESVIPADIELTDFRQDFCFAVQKGNKELLSILNEGLSVVIANGVYDKLHLKWFGPDFQKQPISFSDVLRITLYVLIPLVICFSFISIIVLRKEVRKRTKQLVELNESKDKFFSIIAHDLKSPFLGFLGLTKEMASYPEVFTEEDIKSISNGMHKSASNLFSLLNNLLEWAQMQKGETRFDPVNFSLSELIEKNVQVIKKRSEEKGIAITFMSQDSFQAFGDKNMINSVLMNLLSNAVKFTNRKGIITIDIKESDKHMLQVSVCDTGTGMPDDMVSKLFKMGEKIRSAGTENETGTGLGLLLCKEFVEKNGGKIWVHSELNKGSIFYFTIPGKKIH